MTDSSGYLIDPMAAFFAAVTAVENGQVAEVELMFTNESDATHVAMSVQIVVRRETKPNTVYLPVQREE